MKVMLIYDCGDQFYKDIKTECFDSESLMLQFVNKEIQNIKVIKCFYIGREIKLEAFEKVTEYRIKD